MSKRVDPKKVIGLFSLGLVLMAVLEIFLVWVSEQLIGLPAIHLGWVNEFLGFFGIATGVWLVTWSVWIQFTEGKGTPYPKVATQKLVVRGPYAFTRNPMTLGAALFYLGIAIWFGSIAMIVLVLSVFASLLAFIYTHETKELVDRFGAEYLEYKQKTPFLFPGLIKRRT